MSVVNQIVKLISSRCSWVVFCSVACRDEALKTYHRYVHLFSNTMTEAINVEFSLTDTRAAF